MENINDWDDFFGHVLNSELPKGQVYDVILKNLSIYLLKKGYDETRIMKEIQPIYEKKLWNLNDLLGWFRHAKKENIKDIARGEIVNWCKKNNQQELLKLLPYENFYLEKSDLVYPTDHLPNYNLIEDIVDLKGNEYRLIKKVSYDLLISLAVPQHLKIIKINSGFETDLRIHPLFIMPSGSGKLAVKEGIKKTYQRFNPSANIKEPRTIHSEQLIGKVLERGTGKLKKFIKKEGFIFADLLILEESYEVLTSKEKNDVNCRDILLVALDIYSKNYILKQSIDNLDIDAETISGYPTGNCILFCQPLPFEEAFVTKGCMRRLQTCYQEFPKRSNPKLFKERLMQDKPESESIKDFSDFMRQINQIKDQWSFDIDAKELFYKCHLAIIEQGYLLQGKYANFTRMLEFHLQNSLLKYAALRAISHLRANITKQDVLEAFVDLLEQFIHQLEFVSNKVTGIFDYGERWGNYTGKEQELLEWLYNLNARDETSPVKICDFQRTISNTYNIGDRQVKRIYQQLKKKGIIEDKKGNQATPSSVWLKKMPQVTQVQGTLRIANPKKMYEQAVNIIQRREGTEGRKTDKSSFFSSSPATLPNNTDNLLLQDVMCISDTCVTSSDKPVTGDAYDIEDVKNKKVELDQEESTNV